MKNKELDILNVSHLSVIIDDIESGDNKRRKLHAWKAFNCHEGNQIQYVKQELAALYPKTHKKFRLGDLLIVKKVIQKLSKSYKQDPVRIASNDKETQALDDIYTGNGFKRAFKEFDRNFNLHKYSCLWLKYINPEGDVKKGSYNLAALAPYEFDVVRDEVTGSPLIFILSYVGTDTTGGSKYADGVETVTAESQADTSAQTRIYSVWSEKNFVKVRVTTKGEGGEAKRHVEIIPNENNKKNVNEAGVLPIVFLSRDTAVDYPIPSNLSEQSIFWNLAFSDYKTGSAAQGHGVLTYSYPDGGKPRKDLHTGMHTAIDLPQSTKPNAPKTEANYINASPKLAEQLEGLKFEASNILDDHGIKAGSSIQGTDSESFASGFDRLLAQADVQDVIEDNQSIYVFAEQELFKIIAKMENALNKKTFKEDQKLQVTFPRPKVQIADSEILANIETRERLGLLLPWQKHQIIDPNLDDTAAKAYELEIQAEKEATIKKNADLFEPITEEDNDESP